MNYNKAKEIVKALDELGSNAGMFVNLLKEKQKLAEVQAKIEEIEEILVHNLAHEGACDVIGEEADGVKVIVCPHEKEPLASLTIDEYHTVLDLMLRNMVLGRNSTFKDFFG